MFQNIFSYRGRIRRLEYGLTWIIYAVLIFIITTIMVAGATQRGPEFFITLRIINLIINVLFFLPQSAKRAHDINCSGWIILIPLAPFFLIFYPGTKGENKYGEDPKKAKE